MRKFAKSTFIVVAALFTGLTTLGGCTEIGAAIDCEQMCEQLQTCIDSDLSVRRCSDRCEDKAEKDELRHKLDDCTDCLDRRVACEEMADECPVCAEVTDALL